MLGRNAKDLIGRHVWTEFPEARGQPFQLAYEQAMEEQRPIQLREFYPPWNRWFENRVYPSPEGISIFFTDVTEQVRRRRSCGRPTSSCGRWRRGSTRSARRSAG